MRAFRSARAVHSHKQSIHVSSPNNNTIEEKSSSSSSFRAINSSGLRNNSQQINVNDVSTNPSLTKNVTTETVQCDNSCRYNGRKRKVDSVAQSSMTLSKDDDMYHKPLNIIYQDQYMIIIDKPQGMAVMGAKPSLYRSNLLSALLLNSNNTYEINNDHRRNSNNNSTMDKTVVPPVVDIIHKKPIPGHRLDRATGGLLVLAKTRLSEVSLKTSFAERRIHKRYRAIVIGKLDIIVSAPQVDLDHLMTIMKSSSTPFEKNDEIVNNNIGDSSNNNKSDNIIGVIDAHCQGKDAKTLYQVVQYVRTPNTKDEYMTLLNLWPITGRKHQLRRHLKGIGYPIVGDTRYGGIILSHNSNHQNNMVSAASVVGMNCNDADGNFGCNNPDQHDVLLDDNDRIVNHELSPNNPKDDDNEFAVPTIMNTIEEEEGNGISQLSYEKNEVQMKDVTFSKLCLCAVEITLPHPRTDEYCTYKLPETDWLDFIIKLQEQAWKDNNNKTTRIL